MICTSKVWKLIQLSSITRDLGQLETDIWKKKGRRKTTEDVGLLQNGAGNLATMDTEEAEIVYASFTLIFTGKTSTNTRWKEVKKTEPDSFQMYPMSGQQTFENLSPQQTWTSTEWLGQRG